MKIIDVKKILANKIEKNINLDNIIFSICDRYILGYHHVINKEQATKDGVHSSLWITPESFERQIQWMQSIGDIVDYRTILDTTFFNDRPLFTLTFDDGWKDNYANALPILAKFNLPAHIFLATEAIEHDSLFWTEDIAVKTRRVINNEGAKHIDKALNNCWPSVTYGFKTRTNSAMGKVQCWIEMLKLVSEDERNKLMNKYFKDLNLSTKPCQGYLLSWDNAKEMLNHGISFGSHSHKHTILKGLPTDQIEFELRESKQIIEERLQTKVDSFCYPNARYNGNEGFLLARCGYKYGFCIDNQSLRRCTDMYYLPRFIVSESSDSNLSYFKMRLLEAPFYRTKPHKRKSK